ncbi:MAG: 2,3,4,5-tetrahydropyridine-2,6-dicarboxylate N-succinyltransferase [Planctomycetota bacterium]
MSAPDHPSGRALLEALESGEVRVAEPGPDGAWRVHAWVKEGILALFRSSDNVDFEGGFVDREPLTTRRFDAAGGVRLVPGGSAVRRGAYVAPGCVLMPPMYVNIGAWVGAGTMVDSHALVGSCAQIGERVHLSAGAQIGGVLEPVGSRPVIVEDDALIGAQCGLFEGVRIGRGAVLATGVVLTGSTPVYDLVAERELRGTPDEPLTIPPGAVVVPGARPAGGAWAAERGLSLQCAVIVKVRDEGTDQATALEDALRL